MREIIKKRINDRQGVMDSESMKIIIYPDYEHIVIHKYGFSCKVPDEDSLDVYSINGTLLMKNCKKVLFLDDDILLLIGFNNMCYVFNISTKKFLLNQGFEAVLVFLGDSTEATQFDASSNMFDIYVNTTYLFNGAHIESLLCVKTNGLWKVLDIRTKEFIPDFTCNKLSHHAGNKISKIE